MRAEADQGTPVTGAIVTGLTADSRSVRPGSVFAALPGSRLDGTAFIPDAVRAGAAAIIAPPGTELPDDATSVVLLADENPRRRLARMAAAIFTPPPACVVAVTGTSGKTSTVDFVRQLWSLLGLSAASIGTLGTIAPDLVRRSALTTADPVTLQAELADLARRRVTHAALEASSHGIDQYRLDGVRLCAAAFTNISHEHLDYHGTMAAYLAAKSALFGRLLPPGGTAVLNADSDVFDTISGLCRRRGQRVITFGEAAGDIALHAIRPVPHGQTVDLSVFGTRVSVDVPLVGRFQVANALAALGLTVAAGADALRVAGLLPRLTGVRGRLEPVAVRANGAAVYVDYAHKPAALEVVLSALRPHATGRLWVVFGCGGDRDRAKRPMMGAIAARLADHVIVTDDNPRSEEPAAIRRDIRAGCPDADDIADRADAIAAAVERLAAGDVLVIAGKGHETEQIVGAVSRPFDDAAVARAAAAAADQRERTP